MSDMAVRFDPKTIPPEIRRWSWGAFFLNWIWGIGNQTYIALLALIPGLGFIMMIVLGARGNVWAWRNGRWDSVAHFRRVQRKWAIWGLVIWLAVGGLFCAVIGGVFATLRYSEAYAMASAKVQASPVAASILGSPVSTGWANGKISLHTDFSPEGETGKADLTFSATGPKDSGVVTAAAVKKDGVWSLTRLTLKPDGGEKEIDLLGGTKGDTTL